MKNAIQLQATVQETVRALEAFESLLRGGLSIAEGYAALTKDPVGEGVRSWINNTKEALERWGWVAPFTVGADVRVRDGFSYAGKRGRIIDKGYRPDGRTFFTVRLDISTSTGSSDREYYQEELQAI